MRYLGGHLGTAVTALVDGQLDPQSADRAWAHVHGCSLCTRQVEREGWVKRQLAAMSGEAPTVPPEGLVGSLYGLSAGPLPGSAQETSAAWSAVEEIERRERGRRRTGLAVVGAGSVSAAVLGFASLTGSTLGISGSPTTPSTPAVTRPSPALATSTAMLTSTAHVHGRLPRGVRGPVRATVDGGTAEPRGAGETGPPPDLQR